uniref:Fibronectin type-III domain-containing protein n=1 Tax=Amphimedon queenslandica TaxID=400682 RepID=A0A1X7TT54_AMPQE
MATVAGIYWCLVLVHLILLSSTTELVQTSPSYSPVCPGDRLVFTCTITPIITGTVYWRIPGQDSQQLEPVSGPETHHNLILNATIEDGTITSTGIYESVSVSLNGSEVGCARIQNIDELEKITIKIRTDPPVAVNSIIIDSNGPSSQHNYSTIGNNPNITLDTLNNGSNYSFIIIPIDTIGREGPPSSLIQYIWNVPAQVVNISWDQISTDTITIWWNNNEDHYTTPLPPTQYYIISVYNTSNSIIYTNNTTNTNITITGLPLTDTNYTISIIPVNVIGQGPSATVNVSITNAMTSSSITITLTTDISTSTPLIYITSTSNIVTKTSSTDSSYTLSVDPSTTTIELTPTTTFTSTQSTTTTITTDSATGSNAVPIISGAIGTYY